MYSVWDGFTEWPYVHNGHDYMITNDGKRLSAQVVRRWILRDDKEPIVLFACERGSSCVEAMIDGEVRGVLSYFFLRHFSMDTSFRTLVSEINNSVWSAGYAQKAEVICRADLLDAPFDKLPEVAGRPVVFMELDMCRC
jgi:hypothetical protein